jgi:hypothetical protein
MSAAQHTQGPWAIDPNTGEICAPSAKGYVTVCDPTMGHYLSTMRSLPVDEKQANAARIVQCVNAHDELVAILRRFVDEGYDREQAIAAIAKVTGSAAGGAAA